MEINENIENRNEHFDKEAEYTAEVVPLMRQLHAACEKIGLPYLVHVVYMENNVGAGCGTLMSQCEKTGYAANRCALLGAIAANEISGESLVKATLAAGLASGIIQRGGR